MSVVAIRRVGRAKFEIAADSIVVRGWTQGKDPTAKLWRVGEIIAGTCGKASMGGLFREYIENHQPKSNSEWGWLNFLTEFVRYVISIDNRFTFDDNDFLVIWRGKAFQICGLAVKEVERFGAIGAGMDFALAALHLGHTAKEAVEVACELSTFCERPIRTMASS